MTVIKCKICGGDIELSEDKTIGTCMYCGSTTTLPKIEDEQRASMFNRGNHFRRIGEYDKALATYERIVAEDDTDAEAHWCCALSRFGIEYVEDPATYEWLPTCHRLSFDSFLEDVDYLAAVENSDGITRRQYQKDGAKIAEVQRGILAVSQKEEPFDVFICYKESDENNNRTIDSTLAQDIYYQLTDKRYKVFFSRITLEDKAGTEYEPYIFAALNSAKVMIVVGTKPEYLNAVWVKNEWSRFLSLMKKDRSRVIIPCYRDMDPYDLPEQLSVLQSYDMAKIGFIQDLLRGIEKIVTKDEKKPEVKPVVVSQSGPNVTALLQRGNMALEDGEWESARKYFDNVLNMDATCAEAYLGFAMIDVKTKDRKALENYIFANGIQNKNFERARQFANETLKMNMDQWLENRRQLLANQQDIYNKGVEVVAHSNDIQELEETIVKMKCISGYKDTENILRTAINKTESIKSEKRKREQNYQQAVDLMNAKTSREVKTAAEMFKLLGDYKDSVTNREECLKRIEPLEIKERELEEAERVELDYIQACSVMHGDTILDLSQAASQFEALGDYKDSASKKEECLRKLELMKAEEKRKKEEEKENTYKKAIKLMNSNSLYDISGAATVFEKLGNYKDSAKKRKECLRTAEILEKEKVREDLLKGIRATENKLSQLGIFQRKEKVALKNEIERLKSLYEETENELKEIRAASN